MKYILYFKQNICILWEVNFFYITAVTCGFGKSFLAELFSEAIRKDNLIYNRVHNCPIDVM